MKLLPYWSLPGFSLTLYVRHWIAVDAETVARWKRQDAENKVLDSPVITLSGTYGREKAGREHKYCLRIETCNLIPDHNWPEIVYLHFRAASDEEAFTKAVARLEKWQKSSI